MIIGLITYASETDVGGSTQRLIDAARARGHETLVLRERELGLDLGSAAPRITWRNQPLPNMDVVLVRSGFTSYPTEPAAQAIFIRALEHAGVAVVNTAAATTLSRTKIAMLEALSAAGVPIPATMIVRDVALLRDRLNEFTWPVVVKANYGWQGKGVLLVESAPALLSLAEYLLIRNDEKMIAIQEYVAEANRSDVRVLVIGGAVVTAMERTARREDFRVSGGTGAPTDLTEAETGAALAATQAIGLEIAGVDLVRTAAGPRIFEVNSNPGFEDLIAINNIDVPDRIIAYLETKLRP